MLINKDSHKITTDDEGKQLVKWTTKHAPNKYELKYLTI